MKNLNAMPAPRRYLESVTSLKQFMPLLGSVANLGNHSYLEAASLLMCLYIRCLSFPALVIRSFILASFDCTH